MDVIKIEDLEVFAHHGVLEEETRNGQKFYVNAKLYTKTRAAGIRDSLYHSTHYGEVCEFITNHMKEHTYLLIERVAEMLAQGILIDFPNLRGITIEIRKPYAPIPLLFKSVSVEITRCWHQVYVAVGSNMGNSYEYIQEAVDKIQRDGLCKGVQVSQLIKTKPYGGVEQDDFVNGVMQLETLYEPLEFLHKLQEIEEEANRERVIHWGPRTLDLDILYYDNEILYSKELTIPHYDMLNRDFVLRPLAQLDPYVLHPIEKKTSERLLQELEQKLQIETE
ncbi:MAG: 2-amino-4-hydroxy-6-hydroxymethyldihydropteridine diphosphokinase [Eubacteriales bacterium]